MEPGDRIPLATAIEALRQELVTAVAQGRDERVRFALGDIELEFQVEISRERRANAGIAFWVLSLGGEGSRSTGQTHTVRLTLKPVLASQAGVSEEVIVGADEPRRPD